MSRLTGLPAALQHHLGMTQRTDTLTAMRVDLTLILVPAISWLEASRMLALSGVPAEVAAGAGPALGAPEAVRCLNNVPKRNIF